MSKRLSKSILALAVGGILATTVYIGSVNKQNYEVVDIQGNIDELGDVSVVYQERHGAYKTTEVSVSKEGTDVDNYAKEVYSKGFLSKDMKKYRDRFKYSYGTNSIYKDDKSIGYVTLETKYTPDSCGVDNMELIAHVEDINLETNKKKSYEISIERGLPQDISIDYVSVPVKYNGEIYLTVGMNVEPGYINKKEFNISASEKCLISVYKLELYDETVEVVFEENIGEGNKDLSSIENSIYFSNKNSTYIVKKSHNIAGNKTEKKFELVKYDISKNKLTNIEIPMDIGIEDSIYNYSIDEDKVTFIKELSNNKDKIQVYTTTIDLDTGEVVDNSEKYEIKLEDKTLNHYIESGRIVDDKIYLLVIGNKGNEYANFEDTEVNSKLYVYVLDKDSKKTLYSGKIKEGISINGIIGILKYSEK